MQREHRAPLVQLFDRSQARLTRSLQRRFPDTCPGRVEDAVSDAFTTAIADPRLCELLTRDDGQGYRRLYTVAWRSLRGQLRRRDLSDLSLTPREDEPVWEPQGHDSPEAQILTAELVARVQGYISLVAGKHGGRHPERLTRALEARLFEELDDREAARRYDVPREYVNRSKSALRKLLAQAA